MAVHEPVERGRGERRFWTIAIDDEDWPEVQKTLQRLGYAFTVHNRIVDGARRGRVIRTFNPSLVTYLKIKF